MKKIFIYILILITSCFIIPAIFSKSANKTAETLNTNNVENTIEKEDNTCKEKTEKGEEISIKLLHEKTGETEEVNLEEYLCNVVSAEMPVSFELEALKAQAIVARTYTIFKMENKKHENADICDSSKCCQAWVSKEERFKRWEDGKKEENWIKISKAVDETKGKIITYNNKPINAFFHSNSGGKTELPVNVWGGNNYPYLQVIETSGENEYKQFLSELELSNEELLDKLKVKYGDININFEDDNDIKILEFTESGRVRTIKMGNHNISGVELRNILNLKSNNFEIEKKDGKIKFKVKGYGHGVGMSQTGADSLAKQGKNAEEIIKHFYKNIEIKNVSQIL